MAFTIFGNYRWVSILQVGFLWSPVFAVTDPFGTATFLSLVHSWQLKLWIHSTKDSCRGTQLIMTGRWVQPCCISISPMFACIKLECGLLFVRKATESMGITECEKAMVTLTWCGRHSALDFKQVLPPARIFFSTPDAPFTFPHYCTYFLSFYISGANSKV